MIFKERYQDILRTESEIVVNLGHSVEVKNNVIEKACITITGHFGNCVSVELICKDCCPLGLYNSTDNVGYIIRCLIELFDQENDCGCNFDILNGVPIRLVFDNHKCIAIGHFMEDRFILIEDLMHLNQ